MAVMTRWTLVITRHQVDRNVLEHHGFRRLRRHYVLGQVSTTWWKHTVPNILEPPILLAKVLYEWRKTAMGDPVKQIVKSFRSHTQNVFESNYLPRRPVSPKSVENLPA